MPRGNQVQITQSLRLNNVSRPRKFANRCNVVYIDSALELLSLGEPEQTHMNNGHEYTKAPLFETGLSQFMNRICDALRS